MSSLQKLRRGSLPINKRALTIMELLVVIALIAIALGAFSLPIAKLLKKEKFEGAVDQIISKLTLAQELMLDFRTDVVLTLCNDGNEITCQIETFRQLPKQMEDGINRYNKIQGIEAMAFNASTINKLSFQFGGRIGTAPKGVLTLIANGKQVMIVLKGYPSEIKRGPIDANICQATYPEEIISLI